VEDLLLKYAGKIKLVYKSFPLPMHPWAMKAAIGADCAYEQNHTAFWYFYDHLFQEQGSITPENVGDKLKGYAKDTKLNMARFDTCLDKEQTKPMVERDIKEGNNVGVNATPTFVINGRILQGAQPEEAFIQTINEILK
jgi:protein-disulfide isomerase